MCFLNAGPLFTGGSGRSILRRDERGRSRVRIHRWERHNLRYDGRDNRNRRGHRHRSSRSGRKVIRETWPWWVGGPLIGLVVPAVYLYGAKKWGVSSTLRHLCAATVPAGLEYFRYDWRSRGGMAVPHGPGHGTRRSDCQRLSRVPRSRPAYLGAYLGRTLGAWALGPGELDASVALLVERPDHRSGIPPHRCRRIPGGPRRTSG